MKRTLLATVALMTLVMAESAVAEPLPEDSGIINVHAFGARGDGKTDDTAAILAAIAASGGDTGRTFWQDRIIYLPAGTYIVSNTLLKRYANGQFGSGLALMGESAAKTTIRLMDKAPGFDDPQKKRAVIFTTSKLLQGTPTAGGRDYPNLGEGNDAYMNYVEDLTIDVGRGNPGAVGIDYLGNNIGAVRNVVVRASADSGAVGLSITRKWPGPALFQNLSIFGFGVGIETAQTEYGLTFDRLRLRDQRITAIRNDQNALTFRNLEISGPAPGIINSGDKGFLAIDGGLLSLNTTATDLTAAIDNRGVARIRDLRLESRDANLHQITGPLNGTLQDRGPGQPEWQPDQAPSWLPPSADSLVPPVVPLDRWASVARYGANGDANQDATDALRRAMSSGAPVVYLPHGTYAISDTIEVPATVQRIVGMNSTIHVFMPKRYDYAPAKPMMQAATAGPPLSIEHIAFDHTDMGPRVGVEVSGARDVTIRDTVGAGVTLLDRKTSGGRTFVENTCCGKFMIAGPQPVIAKQLNTEGGGVRITNLGSPLSLLGVKTEGITTVIENRQGARTDIFGGLIYMVRDGAGAEVPAFINKDSWLSAVFAEESLRATSRYSVYVSEGPETPERAVPVDNFPKRGFGRFVPNLTIAPESQKQDLKP